MISKIVCLVGAVVRAMAYRTSYCRFLLAKSTRHVHDVSLINLPLCIRFISLCASCCLGINTLNHTCHTWRGFYISAHNLKVMLNLKSIRKVYMTVEIGRLIQSNSNFYCTIHKCQSDVFFPFRVLYVCISLYLLVNASSKSYWKSASRQCH